MFRYLFNQTALMLTTVFLAAAALLFTYMLWVTQRIDAESAQTLHRELAAHVLHDSPLLPADISDKQAVKHAFHLMMVLGPHLELYILDSAGNILNYDAPAEKILRRRVDLEPIEQLLSANARPPIYGDDPRDAKGRKPFSVTPIERDGIVQGYLYIILGSELQTDVAQQVLGKNLLKYSAVPVGLVLLCGLVTAAFVYGRITRPLQQLAREMPGIDVDRLDEQSAPASALDRRHDEIGVLAREFHRLIEKIREQMQQLQRKKDAQRQLFNQIAHDLRAPLSNALLAVETAESEQTLAPPPAGKPQPIGNSLHNARNNLDKVARLITDILDLARLDAGQIQLSKERYPLVELVHDCVQDFQHKAEQQGITLHVEAGQHYRQVEIDIAQLSRVISNLLSNALRHAKPHSTLVVRVIDEGETIRLEVINEIPEQHDTALPDPDVPEDFDSASSSGYGLGLAICQRILKLHHSRLQRRPHPGQAHFYFSLPVCE